MQPYQVRLYLTPEQFRIDEASKLIPAPSKEKAARKASYALFELPLGPTPGRTWYAAECREVNGPWSRILRVVDRS